MSSDPVVEELRGIRSAIDKLASLFKAANYKVIEQVKADALKTDIRKKIYDLCDGSRPVTQIAQEVEPQKPLKQSLPLLSYHLAILTSQGLLNYTVQKGQKYYYKTLE